jgi:anti-anti-sigma factor
MPAPREARHRPADQNSLTARERFAMLGDSVVRHLFAVGMHAAHVQAVYPQPKQVQEALEDLISEADSAIRELQTGLVEMAGESNPSHAESEGERSAKNGWIKVIADCGKQHVVRLSGELDLAWADDALAQLIGIAASTVVVDLSELTFLDSTGVLALVRAKENVEQNGHRLELRGAQTRPVRRVFELCGFGQLLDGCDQKV